MAGPPDGTPRWASEMAAGLSLYCYRCGKPHLGSSVCPACGEKLDLSQDCYLTKEVCYYCEQDIPRWSNYCPSCGERQEKNNDADYPKQWRRYKLRQIITNVIWTLAVVLAVMILPGRLDFLTTQTAILAGIVLVVIVWGFSLAGMRKGRYWDGTVTRIWTEDGTRKVCVDAGTFEQVPCTVYQTEIRWDNGKTLTRTQKGNGADHEQLRVGDRVRQYEGISRFAKL